MNWNWQKWLNKILGIFWLRIWKDTWLIQLLGDIFKTLVGINIINKVQSVIQQTSCRSLYPAPIIRQVRILVNSTPEDTKYSLSQRSDATLSNSYTVGQTKQVGGVYTAYTVFDRPIRLQNRASQEASTILNAAAFDYSKYSIYKQNKTHQVCSICVKESLQSLGFNKVLAQTDQGLKQCFQLWAVYEEYGKLRDNFTAILELPQRWLYEYPGAIQAAWSIKQNGASALQIKRLFGALGGCPFIRNAGKVYIKDASTVYVDNVLYKGKGECLIEQKKFFSQVVLQEEAKDTTNRIGRLFSGQYTTNYERYPQVLFATSKSPIDVYSKRSYIKGLHVLSDVGLLYAPNTQKSYQDVLFLTSSSNSTTSINSEYRDLCEQRNADQDIPYYSIVSTNKSPAQYILDNFWRYTGCIILAPPGQNTQDMQLAANFIAKNTILGTNLVIYQYDNNQGAPFKLLYPNKEIAQQILQYAKTNGYAYKETFGDFGG